MNRSSEIRRRTTPIDSLRTAVQGAAIPLALALLFTGVLPTSLEAQSWFKRGDAGGDGTVDIDDALLIQDFIFNGGPPPPCMDAADANDDDIVNVNDSVYILNFTINGPAPVAPGPFQCGPDPTPGVLGCATYSCEFIRGDADNNGVVDANDATAINNFLFLGGPMPCLDAGDADDDGAVTATDAIAILNGSFIPNPGPVVCGPDRTADNLDCQQYAPVPAFVRGDADGDGIVTMNDSTVILDFLFNGGPPPGCLAAADADGSTAINQPDSIYILNFLNLAGPPPPAPYPICGVDPTTPLSCLQKQCAFIRGDVDNNGEVNPADATAILNFLNLGIPIPCLDAADSNDDGVINVVDATFLLNSLLIGAVPIPAPGPHVCGFDPTADTLGCAQYTCIPPEDFRRGDCNVDGNIDISDAVFVLGLLFPPAMGGNVATCQDSCDSNDDGFLNIADPVLLLAAIFSGGAPPPPPYPNCGFDPTPFDSLGCLSYKQVGCP